MGMKQYPTHVGFSIWSNSAAIKNNAGLNISLSVNITVHSFSEVLEQEVCFLSVRIYLN